MWINQEELVYEELPELLPPGVLCHLIRGLPLVDATVAVKFLQAVWPPIASAIGRPNCDAHALWQVVIDESKVREVDVGGWCFATLAYHGGPNPE